MWQRIWDGTVGATLTWIASGFVAAVNFMANLPTMLAQLGAWLWSAIVGAAQAVASAVQAAAKVLDQFLNYFFALFTTPVRAILAYLDGWKESIVQAARNLDQIARGYDGSPASAVRLSAAIAELLASVFRSDIMLLLTVLSFAIVAAVTATMATGIGYLIVSQVVPVIISIIVSVIMQAVVPAMESALDWLASVVASNAWLTGGEVLAVVALAMALLQRYSTTHEILKVTWVPGGRAAPFNIETVGELTPVKTARSIALAVLGLVLSTISLVLRPPGFVSVLIDLVALGASLIGLKDACNDLGKVVYGRLTLVLSGVSTGVAAFALGGDLVRASRGE